MTATNTITTNTTAAPLVRKINDIDTIIDAAVVAFHLAADKEFDRWGREDGGSCGGAMLIVDGRSALAKRLIERGLGYKGTGGVYLTISHNLRTQCADVKIAGINAFRAVLITAGVKINRCWTYVD